MAKKPEYETGGGTAQALDIPKGLFLCTYNIKMNQEKGEIKHLS